MRAPTALTAVAIALAAGPAAAQARPDLRTVAGADGQSAIAAAGALVVGTGTFTYERIVTGSQFCERRESLIPVWTATRDQAQCSIGYRCGPAVSSPR